jgi:hypothetical protein
MKLPLADFEQLWDSESNNESFYITKLEVMNSMNKQVVTNIKDIICLLINK